MPMEIQKICAHQPCVCEVKDNDDFCGGPCREAAAANSDTCRCGHLECSIEPALPDPVLLATA